MVRQHSNENTIDRGMWSSLVAHHPQGTVFQTPELFASFQRVPGYSPLAFATEDEQGIRALLVAVVIREPGWKAQFSARSVITGGPLCAEGIDAMEVLRPYDRAASRCAVYSQIRNLFDVHQLLKSAEAAGYRREPHLNYFIDLTAGAEALWQGLDGTRRKQIKRAMTRGLVVRPLSERGDIVDHYGILKQAYNNAGLPIAPVKLFQAAFDVLGPSGMLQVFAGCVDGRIVATRWLLTHRGIVHDWYAAALREHYEKYPNDALVWEALRWGTSAGMALFDFGGAGRPDEPYGVRDFKAKFGGQLVEFGRYHKVHKPLTYVTARALFSIWRRLAGRGPERQRGVRWQK
jgi:hypothetical protein